ncbi:MAG: hypothetical protein ACRDJO_05500 [Actinomycetota bacterium]
MQTSELFRELPDDLLTLRPNTLIAALDDVEDVKAAIEELVAAGFPKEEIYVLGGKEGAEKLDPTGEHHGLRGRLVRLLERFGEETLLLEQHAEHLERGGLTVVVPADDEQVSRAAAVAGRHGAHDMFHLGEGHWEPVGPGPAREPYSPPASEV